MDPSLVLKVRLWLEFRVSLEPILDLLGASRQSYGLRLLPVVLIMTKQTIKEYRINFESRGAQGSINF